MALFAFRAIDSNAAAVSGTVAADTPRQARDSLRGRGFTIHQVEPIRWVLAGRTTVDELKRVTV